LTSAVSSSALVLSDVGDETWGAVLEQGRVAELHVENARRPGIAGNVYKGRVGRVIPGMQAAFVDIGSDKDAFLHVSDLPQARAADFDFEADEADSAWAAPEEAEQASAPPRPPAPPIQDLLREGQEILVQVAKEPMASKGARLTAQIALPGRALVHLPFIDRVFVSRRIEELAERDRLTALAESERRGPGGWIVRTAAEGTGDAAFTRDAAYLRGVWAAIQERERGSGAPVLIHRDLNLAERLLRDVVSEGFEEVVVDSDRLRTLARDFLERYLPGLGVRVRVAEGSGTLLDDMGIHQEIERALKPRIWLKSGGSIVVNPTEALVAIDVNTGKFVGRHSLEETALETNLEAVREIVRMLRLRDLGGIIVIDFIDMIEPANRDRLQTALYEELRKDRSRTRPLAISDFGLVQLTRKRTRRSLDRTLQVACPACGGNGRIRSAIVVYYQVQRALSRGAALAGPDGPTVRLHPATIARFDEEGLRLRAAGGGAAPHVVPDPALSEERFEVVW